MSLVVAAFIIAAFGVALACFSTTMLHWSKWFLVPFLSVATTASGSGSWPNGTTDCKCVSPSLIEATTAELQEGLMKGCFSSVDLVNVGAFRLP